MYIPPEVSQQNVKKKIETDTGGMKQSRLSGMGCITLAGIKVWKAQIMPIVLGEKTRKSKWKRGIELFVRWENRTGM
jgi:hypothetical protein